ncbi:MAG: LytTR family DNA-binding domain-containing protein [Bacteroidales bacterium]|jgi:DNA-binding LytR/AlgR family response regulator|nr:LytTR family DNA-binding domain-containing protein [Bacteroidales bacterium]
MKIKCIVIDDEIPAIEQMTEYIQRVPFLECTGTYNNAIEPLSFLANNKVDLVFLDIEMEGFTGIQFLKALHFHPQIILTTAYDSYAIEAFNMNVADYLLKPISFERFIQAIEKVYQQFYDHKPAEGDRVRQNPRSFFFVKTEFRIQRIDFDDILFIEGMKEYLCIHTRSGKIMVLQSFANILRELPPDNFCRVHKSFIVAINKIDKVKRNRLFVNSHVIPISETYKDAFMLFLSGK